MSDEDAFQAALDVHPDDHTTCLVFADWLEEQGDPRAEGYRAIAMLPKADCSYGKDFLWMLPDWIGAERYATLPKDWFDKLRGGNQRYSHGDLVTETIVKGMWRNYPTRREAEDAAALAFAKLPPERRDELLRQEVLV